MEFPLTGLVEVNVTSRAGRESLYSRKPVVAAPYVAVLGVAAVVGTLGNLVVVMTVVVRYLRSRRQRTAAGSDAGRAFIANLALSDMIVTALINPLAIAGAWEYELYELIHTQFGTE